MGLGYMFVKRLGEIPFVEGVWERFGHRSLFCVLVSLAFAFFASSIRAQDVVFYAENPAFTTETRYAWASGTHDKIYVFTGAKDAPFSITLKAKRADAQATQFKLSKFKTDGWEKEFVELEQKNAVTEATFTVSETGGYQLENIHAAQSTKFYLWVFYDDIQLQELRVVSKCQELTLIPIFNYDTDAIRYDKFTYYDLTVDEVRESQEIGTGYFKTVNWLDENSAPVEVFGIAPRPITPPPYKKFGYKVTIETLTGKQFAAEQLNQEPIAVKAKMKIEINEDLDGITEQWKNGGENPQGECPFYMRMINESENAHSLHWTVRNDLRAVRRGRQDTLFYQQTAASPNEDVRPSHDLFSAGIYRAELRAVNTLSGCQDTFRINVKVDSALLSKNAIPNVFSPNGDGINDVFQIIEKSKNAKSLKTFELRIMNRNGVLVYEYNGDIRKWDGWNGNKNGKGEPLPVGTYFYIIRAVGWDGADFSGKEYKGVLHLFR